MLSGVNMWYKELDTWCPFLNVYLHASFQPLFSISQSFLGFIFHFLETGRRERIRSRSSENTGKDGIQNVGSILALWFISNIVTKEKEEESSDADKFTTLMGRRGVFICFFWERAGRISSWKRGSWLDWRFKVCREDFNRLLWREGELTG